MADLCFRAAAALECAAGTEVEACRRDCVGTKAGLMGKALAKLSKEVCVPDVERKTGPEDDAMLVEDRGARWDLLDQATVERPNMTTEDDLALV